ncbi:MAG: hypothetical protein FWD42_00720 [Solirubrobacterales bacterium]|nr:hypothetical protein [Solirubrobacterales bacterium]
MAGDTATIRVTRTTRDLLAHQAHERGVSLAALVGELARGLEVEAIFESERRARRAEAADPAAEAERGLWEATLEDGID